MSEISSLNPTEVFAQIETWNSKTIAGVLETAAGDDELSMLLELRYGELLNFAGLSSVSDLSKLPAKLKTWACIQRDWEPDPYSSEVLAGIPLLKLEFPSKKFKAFPRWITHLLRLEELNLRNANLNEIPPEIGNLSNLKALNLAQNRLGKWPEGIGRLVKLESLDLSENAIKEIPAEIGELVNLRRLCLHTNWIEALPDALSSCLALEELHMSRNYLNRLPEGLANLPALQYANLALNDRLTELPVEWLRQDRLRELHLGGCSKLSIPDPGMPLSALRVLDISSVPLTGIPPLATQASELESLRFDYTKVEALPASLLELGKLHTIRFEHTPLAAKLGKTSVEGAAEVRKFLEATIAFEANYLEPAELYRMLESGEAAEMQSALDYLGQHPDQKQAAEYRYLDFIRLRTGNPEAGLEDWPAAHLTEKEEKALSDRYLIGKDYISFGMASSETSRLLVDFIGGFVQNFFVIDQYIAASRKLKDQPALGDWIDKAKYELRRRVEFHAEFGDTGPFGRMLIRLSEMRLDKLAFDHADFALASESPARDAFYFFVLLYSASPYFDIFQSSGVELPSVIWLSRITPTICWGDTEPHFPENPLSFERKIKFRIGDDGAFEWHTGPPTG